MGLEAIAGPGDWLGIALDAVTSKEESWRRTCVRRRVDLYKDRWQGAVRELIANVFREPAVRMALEPFIPLVGGPGLTKRISNEQARPLYARAPQRRVMLPGSEMEPISKGKQSPDQIAYRELATEMELNKRLDKVAKLLTPSPTMYLGIRYVDRLGQIVCDVMTDDMVSAIPDPDVPTRPLALIYDSAWDAKGNVTKYVCWDDKVRFFFDSNGNILPDEKGQRFTPHDFGLIPIVDVHRNDRVGTYHDDSGGDLESSDVLSRLLELLLIRKLKSQSHIQLAYAGDLGSFVKDQVSDEESILVVGPGGQLFPINLESDPTAILRAQEAVETRAASNYGISRKRLNQEGAGEGDEEGLKERVAELASVLWEAEQGVFRVAKAVSREHPKYKVNPEAKLVVDLGQLHNRVDRATYLETFREEVRQGRKSFLDGILEDNPEYGGDRELAFKHVQEKSTENGLVIELLREANGSIDSDAQEPGQTAEENGALGPKVRDNKMSRDEAAERASTGRKPDAPT